MKKIFASEETRRASKHSFTANSTESRDQKPARCWLTPLRPDALPRTQQLGASAPTEGGGGGSLWGACSTETSEAENQGHPLRRVLEVASLPSGGFCLLEAGGCAGHLRAGTPQGVAVGRGDWGPQESWPDTDGTQSRSRRSDTHKKQVTLHTVTHLLLRGKTVGKYKETAATQSKAAVT